MNKVKILWSGITDRTGKEALEIAKKSDSVEIVAGICKCDSNFYNYDELDNIKEDFDVIVEFSHKDSFDKILEFALHVKKPIIIGTAGLSAEQMKAFAEASNTIPVFRRSNFRFDETGKRVEIKSFLEYDELINNWKVADLNCRVIGFKELASDILTIAIMMKDKKPNGVYDLDRLFKEKQRDDLYKFLIEAKKQTYANENVKKVLATRVGSYDYEYSSTDMIYHDTYFGGTHFMGEEVVYLSSNNTPIWGMNYYGVTLDKSLSEEAVDKALRPALMKVGEDDILPVRGPKEFINDQYKYTFEVFGDLDYFEGEEIISKNNDKVYVLKCHGGSIKR